MFDKVGSPVIQAVIIWIILSKIDFFNYYFHKIQ